MRIYPNTTVDYEFQQLGSLGYSGSLNDRQFSFLRTSGYRGALADMLAQYLNFSPLNLFTSSEPGVWLDPSDLSTLFQDDAGTTPVTAAGQSVGRILDKSGRGNHATQSVFASRPIYGVEPSTGRRNLLTYSEDHTNPLWVTLGVTKSSEAGFIKFTQDTSTGVHALSNNTRPVIVGQTVVISLEIKPPPNGKFRIASRTADGSSFPYVSYNANTLTTANANGGTGSIQSIGSGIYRVTLSFTSGTGSFGANLDISFENAVGSSNFLGDGTSYMEIRYTQLEAGSTATPYQKVVSQYDVTEAGLPSVAYLFDDLIDDSLNWTAPADNYTVAWCDTAGNVTIQTAQALSGVTDALRTQRMVGYLAINRALTAAETANLTAWLQRKAGV